VKMDTLLKVVKQLQLLHHLSCTVLVVEHTLCRSTKNSNADIDICACFMHLFYMVVGLLSLHYSVLFCAKMVELCSFTLTVL